MVLAGLRLDGMLVALAVVALPAVVALAIVRVAVLVMPTSSGGMAKRRLSPPG